MPAAAGEESDALLVQKLRRENEQVKQKLAVSQRNGKALEEEVEELAAALEAMSAQNEELGLQLLRQHRLAF